MSGRVEKHIRCLRSPLNGMMIPDPKGIGLRLRRIRKMAGLSQHAFAAKFGRWGATYKVWEEGRYFPPCLFLWAVADHFGYTRPSLILGPELCPVDSPYPESRRPTDEALLVLLQKFLRLGVIRTGAPNLSAGLLMLMAYNDPSAPALTSA